MGLPAAAFKIAREEGIQSLTTKASQYFSETARTEFYRIRGYRSVEINDIRAEFVTHGARSAAIELFANTERDMVSNLIDELKPNDVFWDIGANVGFHSCFAGLSTRNVSLVEFEPLRPAVITLKQNTARNSLSPDINLMALSDTDGEITLNPESLSNQFSTDKLTVQTACGDSLIEADNAPRPNIVKIDVEGAESLVIDGMKKTLANENCRAIFLELHEPATDRPSVEDYGSTKEEIKNEIKNLGYQLAILESRPGEEHIKATRPD